MTWARGAKLAGGARADPGRYPFFIAGGGTVESFESPSAHLGGMRRVEVYLPPSYHEQGAHGRSYPGCS
jgi:hypothetical protein